MLTCVQTHTQREPHVCFHTQQQPDSSTVGGYGEKFLWLVQVTDITHFKNRMIQSEKRAEWCELGIIRQATTDNTGANAFHVGHDCRFGLHWPSRGPVWVMETDDNWQRCSFYSKEHWPLVLEILKKGRKKNHLEGATAVHYNYRWYSWIPGRLFSCFVTFSCQCCRYVVLECWLLIITFKDTAV